ncbi:MAG: hypothetical protein M8467_07220 [Anaerolineae bacterium]|nr:hypothetical protein [Anaerolineae bacterium]
MGRLQKVRTNLLPALAAALTVLLAVWLLLAPAESRLGSLVKLVYVHGALVWTGLLAFSLAGLFGLVALVVRHLLRWEARAGKWYRGTQAAGLAALLIWVVYAISAVLVTGLTWGQWIAWNEPRVRVTAMILFAALALTIVARLVDHRDFTAGANLLLGVAPWIAVTAAEAIRHPVNPIGGSGSSAIQLYYLLIQLTVLGLGLSLVAWLWTGAELQSRQMDTVSGGSETEVIDGR